VALESEILLASLWRIVSSFDAKKNSVEGVLVDLGKFVDVLTILTHHNPSHIKKHCSNQYNKKSKITKTISNELQHS